MKKHLYRVTLEHAAGPGGTPASHEPLRFEARNHDDIFAIVQKMRGREDMDEESATAFAVGLKLFSEVMLEHKENPLFADFMPAFVNFMKEMKKGIPKK